MKIPFALVALFIVACGGNPVEQHSDPRLTLSPDSVVIDVGGKARLTASVQKTTEQPQYVSRNQSVATVDASGAITAVAVGSTYVVAALSSRPDVRDSVRVRVRVPVDGEWGLRESLLENNSEFALAEANGKLYVLGGYPPSRQTAQTVQVYDIASDRWQLGRPLPQPNNHGMAAAVNGKIYLLGGQTTDDQQAPPLSTRCTS